MNLNCEVLLSFGGGLAFSQLPPKLGVVVGDILEVDPCTGFEPPLSYPLVGAVPETLRRYYELVDLARVQTDRPCEHLLTDPEMKF
jgi:hypothetical protein